MNMHPAMRLPNREPGAEKHPTHSIAIPEDIWTRAYQKARSELDPHYPSMTALITNLLTAWSAGDCLNHDQ